MLSSRFFQYRMCNIVFCGSLFSVAFSVSWVAFFSWDERSLFLYRPNNGWAKFGIVFLNGCDSENEFLVLSDPNFMRSCTMS